MASASAASGSAAAIGKPMSASPAQPSRRSARRGRRERTPPLPLVGEGDAVALPQRKLMPMGLGWGSAGVAPPCPAARPLPPLAKTAYTRVSATRYSDRNRQQPISIGGGVAAARPQLINLLTWRPCALPSGPCRRREKIDAMRRRRAGKTKLKHDRIETETLLPCPNDHRNAGHAQAARRGGGHRLVVGRAGGCGPAFQHDRNRGLLHPLRRQATRLRCQI